MFRWIQITKEQADESTKNNSVPRNSGYEYTNEKGVKMVEYHVDSCTLFQYNLNEMAIYGGNLRVRNPKHEKPLIIFGYNECIFKQYLLTKNNWMDPDDETVLVPKDEGQGVMISAFQCREFEMGITNHLLMKSMRAAITNQLITFSDSLDTCHGYMNVINRGNEIDESSLSENLI